MGDLTTNISQHELDCKCGKCDVTIQDHEPVIQCVQKCCDYFARKYGVDKVVLKITSAARCYEYNRIPEDQGGPGSSDGSQHPRCSAIDHKIFVNGRQIPPAEVADYYDRNYEDSCGIKAYNSFTHFDTRASKWRG